MNFFSLIYRSDLGISVTVTGQAFRDRRQLLQIQPDNSIREQTRVLLVIPLGHINHVGFQNDGPDPPVTLDAMHGGDGAVIPEPVLAPSDAETGDVSVVVEQVEPLGAGGGR